MEERQEYHLKTPSHKHLSLLLFPHWVTSDNKMALSSGKVVVIKMERPSPTPLPSTEEKDPLGNVGWFKRSLLFKRGGGEKFARDSVKL